MPNIIKCAFVGFKELLAIKRRLPGGNLSQYGSKVCFTQEFILTTVTFCLNEADDTGFPLHHFFFFGTTAQSEPESSHS